MLAELVETIVKEPNTKGIMNRITCGWQTDPNYNKTVNGRVRVLWDTNTYKVHILAKEA